MALHMLRSGEGEMKHYPTKFTSLNRDVDNRDMKDVNRDLEYRLEAYMLENERLKARVVELEQMLGPQPRTFLRPVQ